MRISTIGSALIKSPGAAPVFHTYGPNPRRARRSLIAVRSSVIWIDLIIVFGAFGGFSGSSVKVGGPLCGGEVVVLGARAPSPAPRSVGSESLRDSAPSLTVGLVPRLDGSKSFFPLRSITGALLLPHPSRTFGLRTPAWRTSAARLPLVAFVG